MRVKLVLLGLICGFAVSIDAATGDCYRRAATLSVGQSRTISLVNEYDPDWSEYFDWGCYYFKIVCQKGKAYTVYTSTASDGVSMDICDISNYDGSYMYMYAPWFDWQYDRYGDAMRGILYADDWDADSPSSVVYIIRLDGEIGTGVSLTFVEGVVSETLPPGANENPIPLTMSANVQVRSFAQLSVGETWFIARPMLPKCKYIIETTSGTEAFPVSVSPDTDGSGFEGALRALDIGNGNSRIEVFPAVRGSFSFSIGSDAYRSTCIRCWQATGRLPSEHEYELLRVDGSVDFVPGRINAPGSDWYDEIIDERLFGVQVEADVPYMVSTSSAVTNLLMNVYDGNGNVLLKRVSAGGVHGFDVAVGFSVPRDGVYYIGIAENLSDEINEEPSGNSVSLSLARIEGSSGSIVQFREITFDAAGGTCAETVCLIAEGYAIGSLPTPTREKYEFLGWFSDPAGGVKVSRDVIVSENRTFYAHWRPVCRIVFHENCGYDEWSGSMDEIVSDPDDEVELPNCGFVREGRVFIGWSTRPNGVVEYNAGDKVVMDEGLELYAIWDGPPQFITDEYGNLEYVELNGATEIHIPVTVKHVYCGAFDGFPDSLFDTNSIPCLKLLDGWVVGVTDDYWNIYGTGDENAPYWDLDLTGVRGVVDGVFWGDVRIASLVATQSVLDFGVSALFGTSVSSVTIADGAATVWQHSLAGLENLTNLTIASSIARIEQDAFDECPESLSRTNVVRGLKTVDGWVVGLADDYLEIYGQCDEYGNPVRTTLDLTGARGVADYALLDAGFAHSVFVPDTMLNIGEYSFYGCPVSAFSVAAGNPNYSSSGGILLSKDGKTLVRVPQGMGNVHVPEGVETIAPCAFLDSRHGAVVIPPSVSCIGEMAFSGCSIDHLVFEGDAPEIDDETFANMECGMVYVSSNSTGWGEDVPGRWKGLLVDFKEAVFKIDENGWLVWVDPKGTTDIAIPSGVTRIQSGAFGDCWSIDSVKIPSSVTQIEQGAFDGCDMCVYDTKTVPGVKIIDRWAVGLSDDYWNIIEPNGIEMNVDLQGVRGVADCAFQGASMIVSIVIPESLRFIGEYAFGSCGRLSSVSLGNGIESIGAYAFNGCPESLFARDGASDALLVGNWAVGHAGAMFGYSSGGNTAVLPGVRGIADRAFEGWNGLRNVMAESLEHVGANAFDGCDEELFDTSSVRGARVVAGWVVGPSGDGIPEEHLKVSGVRGIADCAFARSGLRCVTVGPDCAMIGKGVFEGCPDLSAVSISDGVEELGINAFATCGRNLDASGGQSLYDTTTIPGVRIVDGWAVAYTSIAGGCLDLAGLRGMAAYAFADCSDIGEVRIAEGIPRIPRCAFLCCENLRQVTIPDSVVKIGRYAFDGCNPDLYDFDQCPGVRLVDGWAVGVDKANIPSGELELTGIRGIADLAFADCREITGMTVPKSAVTIGYGAFSGCSSMERLSVPFVGSRRGNSETSDAVFGYVFGSMPYAGGVATRQEYREPMYGGGSCCGYAPNLRYESVFYIPRSLKSVEVSDETLLCYGAFSKCSFLESVMINEGVRAISESAFEGCDALAYVEMPESVTDIGGYAFNGCTSLASMTISGGVESVGDYAFGGCLGLKDVTIGSNVAYLGYGAFSECTGLRDFYFLGDAPYAEYDVFDGASKRMTIYVTPGTTGWSSGSSDELPAYWPYGYYSEYGNIGRRIKIASANPSEGTGGDAGAGGGSGSGASGGATGNLSLTITNVVVHYVTQCIPSDAVIPSTTAGIVNIISEVNAGAAVAITQEWAAQYPEFVAKFGNDFAKAVTAQTGKTDGTGKPMLVWQDFVAGTDPTDPSDVFTASITFDKDTNVPIVSWTPELPETEAVKRAYKVFGKVRLNDPDWVLVNGDVMAYNFFKVTVEMR